MSGSRSELCLAALLLGSVFVIFSGALEAAPIELWLQGHPAHMELLKPILADFNASQNEIQVSLLLKEASPANVVAAYAAGAGPDIIESAGIFTQQYAPQGMLADLTPLVGEAILKDYFPATAADNSVDGHVYSLSAFLQIEGMYYNPDILNQAGVVEPRIGWTWDDLRTSARKARRLDANGVITTWGIASTQPRTFDFILLAQARGQIITPDMQVTIDTEQFRTVFKWIVEQMDESILRYRSLAINKDIPSEANFGAKTAFAAEASYRQDLWNRLKSPMMTAPPLRQIANSEPATLYTDRSWGIMNVSRERQAAAWEVVKYLIKPDVATRFALSLGYPVSTRSAMQTREYQAFMNQNTNLRRWTEWWAGLKPWYCWPVKATPTIDAVLVPEYVKLLKKTISYSEFVENSQRILTEKLVETFGKK